MFPGGLCASVGVSGFRAPADLCTPDGAAAGGQRANVPRRARAPAGVSGFRAPAGVHARRGQRIGNC